MSEKLFSPHWYRVAALKPRLAAQARIESQEFRGESWQVITDTATGRHHRCNAATWTLLAAMDGERSVDVLWHDAQQALCDAAPTQDEVIALLGKLHAADLLRGDLPPDTAELFRRGQRERDARWRGRLLNPLSIRIPLADPDRLLTWMLPFTRSLFTRAGAFVWLAVIAFAALLALKHASGLVEHAGARALEPGNLLLLCLLYPLVKLAHELGHGLATRAFGGAVHELGVMLLVLIPAPYIDASAANAFPDPRRRIAVAAAGIAVELMLAALALFIWMFARDGWLRDAALDVMLIGGISTLLFNGNPLLRFDGYYMLADALGMPGLAARSNHYCRYLAQRYLFGLRDASMPVVAHGERAWLVGYAVASTLYRIGLTLVIAIALSAKYLLAGMLLALWALIMQIGMPLFNGARFLLNDAALDRRRGRALGITAGAGATLALVLFVLPMPLSTRAHGVIWLAEQAQVRAPGDGFLVEWLAADGAEVKPGDALARLSDPDLDLQTQALTAERRAVAARYFSLLDSARVEAALANDELRALDARLAHLRDRSAREVLRAAVAGTFVVSDPGNQPGRFYRQGEAVGYVLASGSATARVVLEQDDAGLVRRLPNSVSLRAADRPGTRIAARMLHSISGAEHVLPSRALGTGGGGSLAVDPLDERGLRTRDAVFQIDLELDSNTVYPPIGTRVIARFAHGYEPAGFRIARALRGTFLRADHDKRGRS